MSGELINGRDIDWDFCAPESIEQEFGRERGHSVRLVGELADGARRVRDVLQRATTRRLG